MYCAPESRCILRHTHSTSRTTHTHTDSASKGNYFETRHFDAFTAPGQGGPRHGTYDLPIGRCFIPVLIGNKHQFDNMCYKGFLCMLLWSFMGLILLTGLNTIWAYQYWAPLRAPFISSAGWVTPCKAPPRAYCPVFFCWNGLGPQCAVNPLRPAHGCPRSGPRMKNVRTAS